MAKTYARNAAENFRREIEEHPAIKDFLDSHSISQETLQNLKQVDLETLKALKTFDTQNGVMMNFSLDNKAKSELNILRQEINTLADKIAHEFAEKSKYYETYFGSTTFPKSEVIKSLVKDKINSEMLRRKNEKKLKKSS